MLWLFCRRCAGMFRSAVIVALCPYCQSKRVLTVVPSDSAVLRAVRITVVHRHLRVAFCGKHGSSDMAG